FEIDRASRAVPAASTPRAAASRMRFSGASAGWFLAGAAIVALAVGVPLMLRSGTPGQQLPMRVAVSLPPDTTLALSRGSAVALSPDGRSLVYAGRSKGKVQLYLRALDRFDAQPIAGTDDA